MSFTLIDRAAHSRSSCSSVGISRLKPGPRKLAAIQCSSFSSSSPKKQSDAGSHYSTLGVPQNASRMEIKAAYFRLSKKFHPDTRTEGDGDSTERFHKVSEAYTILSDDRKRRTYDRTLLESSPGSRYSSAQHSRASSTNANRWAHDLHERRRRGATHAWEGPRGYRPQQHPHQHPYSQHLHPNRHRTSETANSSSSNTSSTAGSASGYSGFSSTQPRTGYNRTEGWGMDRSRLSGRERREEEERELHDRLVNESTLGRFLSGLGIILVISWVGGFARGWGG